MGLFKKKNSKIKLFKKLIKDPEWIKAAIENAAEIICEHPETLLWR